MPFSFRYGYGQQRRKQLLVSLFTTFFRIGLFTFGGGYSMIANMHEIVVEKKKWLDDDELMQVITVAESTPGPIAINLATYVGYKKEGFKGSLFSTLGVTLPSVVIIYVISLILDSFMANRYVAYAFTGIKCAVAFLILRAGIEMFRKLDKKLLPLAVFSAVFAAMICFELFSISFSSIFLIIIGGIIGIAAYAPASGKEGAE